MNKEERIAAAISSVIRDIDLPVFKEFEAKDLLSVSLSGNLDSLGMVNLIIGVEDAIKQEFGEDIPLLGMGTEPFRTVGTLVEHINRIL